MLKNTFLLIMSRGSRIFFSVIVTMLFSRTLSVSDYGIFKQFMLFVNFSSSLFILGIPNAISYYFPRFNLFEQKKMTTMVFHILILLSIINFLLFYFLLPLFMGDDWTLEPYIYFLAIYSSLLIIVSILEYLYVATNRSNKFLVNNFIVILTFLGLLIGSYFNNNSSLLSIMKIYIIVEIIKIIITLFDFRKFIGIINKNFDKKILKLIIKFSIPVWLTSLITLIQVYFNNFLASYTLDTEKYAIYINGVTEIPLLSILSISLSIAIIPEMSRYVKNNDIERALLVWNKICSNLLELYCYCAVFFLLFSKEYINIIFSSKYSSSIDFFELTVLKLPLYAIIANSLFMSFNYQRKNLNVNIIFLVINLAASFILAINFGMWIVTLFNLLFAFIQIFVQIKLFEKENSLTGKIKIIKWQIICIRCVGFLIIVFFTKRIFEYFAITSSVSFIISGLVLCAILFIKYKELKAERRNSDFF